jgi:large subunit ribosomal protein L14
MLFTESKFNVSDNSGALRVKCIKVRGSSKPRAANFADTVMVSIRHVRFKHKIKANRRILKGALYNAIIVRTKKPVFFADKSFVKFHENSAVIIKKNQPRTFGGPKLAGNRVFGPIVFHRKLKKKFPKLFSLSPFVLV